MWSDLVPSSLLAWLDRRRAMRGLKELQRVDRLVLTLDEGNLVNRAKMAIEAGDREAGLRHWNEALARYPAFATQSHDALWIMLRLELFDEAEALMLAGIKRAPGDPRFLEGYARVANFRGDTEVAIDRWSQVRKRFPDSKEGYAQSAQCLQRAGRSDSAEALIAQAAKRFPEDRAILAQRAAIAEQRKDWPEALRRWEAMGLIMRVPEVETGIARALVELGRIDEAEARLTQLHTARPQVEETAIALARLAATRGDKETELQRWSEVRRRFPKKALGYREELRMLSAMERHDDADTVLQAAVKAFPNEAWAAVEHAVLASRRQDWAAAETRWAAVRAKWPERPDGYHRGAEALAALGRQEEAADLRAEHKKLSEA